MQTIYETMQREYTEWVYFGRAIIRRYELFFKKFEFETFILLYESSINISILCYFSFRV